MRHIDQSGPGLDEIRERLTACFERRFGAGDPPRAFSAPGRVNLMGAHLDYNGGPALPLAVDRRTWVLSRPSPGSKLTFASLAQSTGVELELARLPEERVGDWGDYARGVVRALLRRGARPEGAELLVGGDLPIGAGLSSSAALCLALCLALERGWGLELSPRERVEVALEAERGFVGVSCGILDPYAISFARVGQVLWLETRQGRHEHLPLDTGSVRLVLVDSGTRRSLASGEYNSRVEECERALAVLRSCGVVAECLADVSSSQLREHAGSLDRVLYRRVQHVVGEVERTRAARSALLCGDLVRVGGLMRETQDSLRELFEVSVPALDRLIARALEVGGVHGGRLVGAGFGGCAAFLVEQHAVSALEQVVRQANRTPCGEASGIWVLDSAEGPREH